MTEYIEAELILLGSKAQKITARVSEEDAFRLGISHTHEAVLAELERRFMSSGIEGLNMDVTIKGCRSREFFYVDQDQQAWSCPSKEEARENADGCCDLRGDHWPEGMSDVGWGELVYLESADQKDLTTSEEDPSIRERGLDFTCSYELEDVFCRVDR